MHKAPAMLGTDFLSISCLPGHAPYRPPPQTVLDARRRIWLVDSKGLVTRQRGDSSTLEGYKLPFCHNGDWAAQEAQAQAEHAPDLWCGWNIVLTAASRMLYVVVVIIPCTCWAGLGLNVMLLLQGLRPLTWQPLSSSSSQQYLSALTQAYKHLPLHLTSR